MRQPLLVRASGVPLLALLAAFLILGTGCGASTVTVLASMQAARNDASTGQYSAALAPLAAVLSQDPTDVSALLLRASCYAGLGQYNLAASDAQAAARVTPTSATFLLLAGYYWDNGQTISAAAALTAAARAAGTDPAQLMSVATQQIAYAAYGGAQHTLLLVAPSERAYTWYIAQGQVDAVLGTVAQVETNFAQGLRLSPLGQRAPLWMLIGDTWLSQGHYNRALSAYDDAASSQGSLDTIQLQLQIATVEGDLGKPLAAAAIYQKVLTQTLSAPRRDDVELALARAWSQAGYTRQALTLLRGMLRTDLTQPTRAQVDALLAALQ